MMTKLLRILGMAVCVMLGVAASGDVRAGVAWEFTPHWGIFGEYRFNYFTTSVDRDIELARIHADADLYIHSALAGVRFSWG